MKIAINKKHSRFYISQAGCLELLAAGSIFVSPARWVIKGIPPGRYPERRLLYTPHVLYDVMDRNEALLASRCCPLLIGLLQKGGEQNIKVVDVPDDADVYIKEYDGIEWVAEKHRTWR